MYIPWQQILGGGFAASLLTKDPKVISSGKILDYQVEKCLDDKNNQRCSVPFPVTKSTSYNLEWSTDGAISHTTIEIRDAGSDEIVFYRDTNGEWTAKKNELVYVDFKPKVYGQGNKYVDYKITLAEDE